MGDSADWNEENTRLVCALFAEQVKACNRSGTHLNRTGFQNVIEKFKEKTGLSYSKMPFKNKWDKLRAEYGNWKRLAKETGIGWDSTKQTYQAPDDWWKKANKQYKGIAKFKDRPIQNEEQLTIMFEDIRNTGDDHWAPSTGAAPQSPEHDDVDKDKEYEGHASSDDCDELTPPSANATRKRPGRAVQTGKGKKPKSERGHWVQDQLSKIISLSEKSTASCDSLARKEENSGCSIKEVMALVKECGAVPGQKQHFIASQVFVKKAEREMFMTLETPEERFQWLTMKHDWVTRNDVSK